jgi:hypothetical protein
MGAVISYLHNVLAAGDNLRRCIRTGESDHKGHSRTLTVLIELDELVNALFGRHRNTTISHHLGLEARRYHGTIPLWRKPLEGVIYRMLEKVDPGHCERSIEVQP